MPTKKKKLLDLAKAQGHKVHAGMSPDDLRRLLEKPAYTGGQEAGLKTWRRCVRKVDGATKIPSHLRQYEPFENVTLAPHPHDKRKAWLIITYRERRVRPEPVVLACG